MSSLRFYFTHYLIACFALWSTLAVGEGLDVLQNLKNQKGTERVPPGSIFVFGDPSLDKLMTVRVLGSVPNSGIYYVPPTTDLLSLLSLAGGPTEKAKLDEVTIKRTMNGKFQVIEVDLEKLVTTESEDRIVLQANDLILIPKKENLISEEVLRTVSFIAALATIFGTVAIGVNNIK